MTTIIIANDLPGVGILDDSAGYILPLWSIVTNMGSVLNAKIMLCPYLTWGAAIPNIIILSIMRVATIPC